MSDIIRREAVNLTKANIVVASRGYMKSRIAYDKKRLEDQVDELMRLTAPTFDPLCYIKVPSFEDEGYEQLSFASLGLI